MGVIIVTFQSDGVIGACVESLRSCDHADLRVIICDNNSTDDTLGVLRRWAGRHGIDLVETQAGDTPDPAPFTFVRTGGNLGFAGGVNAGLELLLDDPQVDLFWILNPDGEALPDTASAFARHAETVGPFSLMGGRIRYHEAPQRLQSDGGVVSSWSGICRNLNAGLLPDQATMPNANTLDFISGASMVASRAFVESAGLLSKDYFLYYEEVDWATRRGDLPLVLCPDAIVLHHGGTSIGTGAINRRASPFANYFNYRNRMRFMRRFHPLRLPAAWVLSMLRVIKLFGVGARDEAVAAARGCCGLAPPAAVRDRIAPQDRARAFTIRENGR
ncbi:glycosyltransferase family 2 protein [Rhodobacteraceae bacterium KMM 6894]|nr:glycosyltransferase family 2 protein [Rhodobacteraceae bacterium KMM 6894]